MDKIDDLNSNLKQPLPTAQKKTKKTFNWTPENSKDRRPRLKQTNLPTIKIMFTNIDQMTSSKKNELMKRIEHEKPMIIAVSEVKLKMSKDDTEQTFDYKIPNYSLHPVNLTDTIGRGIAVYTHIALENSVLQIKSPVRFEEACILEIRLRGGDKLLFSCLYRSPTRSETSDTNNELLLDLLKKISDRKYSHVCIVGDFNYKTINWKSWTTTGGENSPELAFIEGVRDCYLYQHVENPTRRRGNDEPSLLDLALTNEAMQIANIQHHAPIGKSDHDVISFDFHCYLNYSKPKVQFAYAKGDFDGMKQNINESRWKEKFENDVASLPNDKSRVEQCWNLLKSKYLSLRDKFVPKSTTSSGPTWREKGSFPTGKRERDAIKDKNKKHRAWMSPSPSSPNREHARLEYTRARNKVRTLLRKAKRFFEKGIAKQCKKNPKGFWAYTRSKLKTRSGIAPLLSNPEDKETLAYDDKEKADILQNQFSSVFTREPDGDIPRLPQKTKYSVKNIHVTVQMVLEILKNLKDDKSCGPDEMHPRMLKELADDLAAPLATLFNMSIQDGVLPEEWKTAFVSPIFKKGARNLAVNYRPISLTCILCKVLENIVRKTIMEHLTSHNLLSNKQHGFITLRSTVTQLLMYMDYCAHDIADGHVVDAIYLDFWKAFDTVPHRRLTGKLEAYGIGGNILEWINAFLTGRSQVVQINGVNSESAKVISGIPQGSVLGPLLFVVYINDLLDNINSTGLLFADDTKIFRKITSEDDAKLLQQDIALLEEWSKIWLLKFNADKCHVLTMGKFENIRHTARYKICNEEMEHVGSEKDLGVTFDENLRFEEHIANKVQIANAIVGQIRRSFTFLDGETFRRLYTALVRPHLEYAQAVWSPYLAKHINMIERVQIRATKLVDGMGNMDYEERLRQLKLPTLKYRRKRGDMIEVFKHHNSYDKQALCPTFEPRQRITRNNSRKVTERIPKDGSYGCQTNSFYYRTTRVWNELPDLVVSAESIDAFKNKLDEHWEAQHYT